MHNNFYFLRQVSKKLDSILTGYTLVSCFTQNKDELVLEFNNTKDSFFIRADLSPSFCCLSFPQSFKRARKNSVDLFNEVTLKKVEHVRQYENERCFSIGFGGGTSLLFKMHGNRSNIILFDDNQIALFRNSLVADNEIGLDKLDRPIDWSKESYVSNADRLKETYFTFGKQIWNYLDVHGFRSKSTEERWSQFQELVKGLNHPRYIISLYKEKLILTLVPLGEVKEIFDDPLKAATEFYSLVTTTETFAHERNDALKKLRARLDNVMSYISKNNLKLDELRNDTHYQAWGDLIMANLHTIKAGMDAVTVEDLYNNNQPLVIKLKRELSPQKNAETYYRKGKNQQIEITKLQESISAKEKEQNIITQEISAIDANNELKGLRSAIDNSSIIAAADEKQDVKVPYKEFEFKNFRIWVGKNAAANDELTLKYGFKEDLWFHAKDVAGSHVLLKYQAGKVFPKDVIEYAASLAAYFSKRKGEKLCPVAYTQKKYVRKRKGDPAGAVVVERETVILVEPNFETAKAPRAQSKRKE